MLDGKILKLIVEIVHQVSSLMLFHVPELQTRLSHETTEMVPVPMILSHATRNK